MVDSENCTQCGKLCVPILIVGKHYFCSVECIEKFQETHEFVPKFRCNESECPIMKFIETIDRAAYPKGLFDYMLEYIDKDHTTGLRPKSNSVESLNSHIEFYNHEKIKEIFENIVDNLGYNIIKSKFTTDVFFRTEMDYENNILVDVKKEFNVWVDRHGESYMFDSYSEKIPLIKALIKPLYYM